MRLHYMGKYNLDPKSIPHGEHISGAVKFKEAETTKELGIIANLLSLAIFIVLLIISIICTGEYPFSNTIQWMAGCLLSLLILFPHELLHAVCFKEDVYLYTNLRQGMLFVTGPETMSKCRFIFMSLLPNIVFGIIPYLLGMLSSQYSFLLVFGMLSDCAGSGDYYNVFNALTQMPKGARTYLYQFNSYWYIPE